MERERIFSVFVVTVAILMISSLPVHAQFHRPIDEDTMPWTLGPEQKEGISSTNMFYEDMLEEGTANYYLKYRDELDLTEDQIARIRELRLTEIESQSDIRKQYKIANQQLNDLLEKQDPDMRKVEEKIREIERLRSEYTLAGLKSQIELQKTLTPEQQEFYTELTDKLDKKSYQRRYWTPDARRQQYQRMKRNRGY